ncbi:MAG: carboxylesterase family protein [bacterium]|nr:carboxylesterase family protein [bacterium]
MSDPRSHLAYPPLLVLLAAALLTLACMGRPPETPDPPAPASMRATPLGDVIGSEGLPGSHRWRGLPFAQPPVGELRWRPPLDPEPWDGTREALAQPPACPQFASLGGGRDGAAAGEPTGLEDCLYLNVFAPAWTPDAVPTGAERRPVLFWIHGGGNTVGDASTYDGGRLAAREDVVVVIIQYRLGPLGWLRHPALRAGAEPVEASGNFGTLDLIQALHWVKGQIASFGGDPDNVTIFGESAGGHDVTTLLLSPLARGLFHRAIVQSGGARLTEPAAAEVITGNDPSEATRNRSEEVMLRWLVASGQAEDRAAALELRGTQSNEELAAFARSLSANEVLAAFGPAGVFGMVRMPKVFADGEVLPDVAATRRFADGHYNQVPVMLGTNRDESKLFLLGDRRFFRIWFGMLPSLRDEDGFERESRHVSDMWKLRGVDGLARALAADDRPPVFAYRFDWDEEPRLLGWDFSRLLGAAHGLEVFFVFGGFELGGIERLLFSEQTEASRKQLSERMMSYWAQFAATGDPGRGRNGDLPTWTRWSESHPDTARLQVLDSEADGGLRMTADSVTRESLLDAIFADARFPSDAERCSFLWRHARLPGVLDDTSLQPSDITARGCDPEPAG